MAGSSPYSNDRVRGLCFRIYKHKIALNQKIKLGCLDIYIYIYICCLQVAGPEKGTFVQTYVVQKFSAPEMGCLFHCALFTRFAGPESAVCLTVHALVEFAAL